MRPPQLDNAYASLRDETQKVLHNRDGEPRWPAIVALVVNGALNFALPKSLVVGPKWLPLAIIGALIVPTIWTHNKSKHNWNNILGYTISGVTTLFLLWSVWLLVTTLPEHKETPGQLLKSAGVLWVTNVVVFALWYWRIDAGGPNQRDRRARHQYGSFLFPQMTLDEDTAEFAHMAVWTPNFWDYLFLAFNHSTALSPTDTAVLSRWAKLLVMAQSAISLIIIALLAARAINTLQ
jgi:branched-subunit amino acid transport protein